MSEQATPAVKPKRSASSSKSKGKMTYEVSEVLDKLQIQSLNNSEKVKDLLIFFEKQYAHVPHTEDLIPLLLLDYLVRKFIQPVYHIYDPGTKLSDLMRCRMCMISNEDQVEEEAETDKYPNSADNAGVHRQKVLSRLRLITNGVESKYICRCYNQLCDMHWIQEVFKNVNFHMAHDSVDSSQCSICGYKDIHNNYKLTLLVVPMTIGMGKRKRISVKSLKKEPDGSRTLVDDKKSVCIHKGGAHSCKECGRPNCHKNHNGCVANNNPSTPFVELEYPEPQEYPGYPDQSGEYESDENENPPYAGVESNPPLI